MDPAELSQWKTVLEQHGVVRRRQNQLDSIGRTVDAILATCQSGSDGSYTLSLLSGSQSGAQLSERPSCHSVTSSPHSQTRWGRTGGEVVREMPSIRQGNCSCLSLSGKSWEGQYPPSSLGLFGAVQWDIESSVHTAQQDEAEPSQCPMNRLFVPYICPLSGPALGSLLLVVLSSWCQAYTSIHQSAVSTFVSLMSTSLSQPALSVLRLSF